MTLKKLGLVAALGAVFLCPAEAQWQAPAHAVPVGTGSGTGFNYVGPCASGVPIVGAGASADPVCSSTLASPNMTGTPTAPTASPGTNSTQVATTAFVENAVGGGGGGSTLLPPGGRLTASAVGCSGAALPIQVNEVSGTAICYSAYKSNHLAIANVDHTFSTQLQATLDATHHVNDGVYDVFGYWTGSVLDLCIGPQWASKTSRSLSINLQSDGTYLNGGTLSTCYNNNVNKGPISAGNAIYLGTIYVGPTNGTITWNVSPAQAAGGTNTIMGVYNAYNRVKVRTIEQDSTSTWTVSGGTWGVLNSSTNNRITYVDGLGMSQIYAKLNLTYSGTGSGAEALTTTICIDCVSPGTTTQIFNQGATAAAQYGGTIISEGTYTGVGAHYLQALENGIGGMTAYGNTYSGMMMEIEN